ncbi:hypothetical protein TorRG33x02_042840, partial [Trema orientale]
SCNGELNDRMEILSRSRRGRIVAFIQSLIRKYLTFNCYARSKIDVVLAQLHCPFK